LQLVVIVIDVPFIGTGENSVGRAIRAAATQSRPRQAAQPLDVDRMLAARARAESTGLKPIQRVLHFGQTRQLCPFESEIEFGFGEVTGDIGVSAASTALICLARGQLLAGPDQCTHCRVKSSALLLERTSQLLTER
jgi:hypothetical protein